MYSSGDLNDIVEVLIPQRSNFEAGSNDVAYVPSSPSDFFYAHVEDRGVQQAFISDQLKALRRYKITLRYRSDLQVQNQRLAWDGRVLQIESVVDPDYRREWLELNCYADYQA